MTVAVAAAAAAAAAELERHCRYCPLHGPFSSPLPRAVPSFSFYRLFTGTRKRAANKARRRAIKQTNKQTSSNVYLCCFRIVHVWESTYLQNKTKQKKTEENNSQ
jgi:hypothetical protein